MEGDIANRNQFENVTSHSKKAVSWGGIGSEVELVKEMISEHQTMRCFKLREPPDQRSVN